MMYSSFYSLFSWNFFSTLGPTTFNYITRQMWNQWLPLLSTIRPSHFTSLPVKSWDLERLVSRQTQPPSFCTSVILHPVETPQVQSTRLTVVTGGPTSFTRRGPSPGEDLVLPFVVPRSNQYWPRLFKDPTPHVRGDSLPTPRSRLILEHGPGPTTPTFTPLD